MITLPDCPVADRITTLAGVHTLSVPEDGFVFPLTPKSKPVAGTLIPPAVLPSCTLIWSSVVSTDISPAAPVKLLFWDVVPRRNCNCVGI